jgi:O-antigen ligase
MDVNPHISPDAGRKHTRGGMVYRYQALILLWAFDAIITISSIAHCDNFVTPKEAGLGISAVVILCAILAAAVVRGERPRAKIGLPGWFLLAWIAAQFASSLISGNTLFLSAELTLPITYFLIYLSFLWLAPKDAGVDNQTMKVAALFGLLFALHGILQYIGIDFLSAHSRFAYAGSPSLRVYSLFGNSDLLADFLAVALPVSIGAAFSCSSKAGKVFAALSALVIAAAIAMSGSRGAMAASVGSTIFFFVLFWERRSKAFKTAAAAAAIILTLTAIACSTLLIPGKTGSVKLRLMYWETALDMFVERPAFGGGPGYFRLNYPEYQKKYFEKNHSSGLERLATLEMPGHSHNEYLNAMADSGAAGAIFFILAIGSGIYMSLKKTNRPILYRATWGAAAVSFAIISFFGYPLRIPPTGLFLPFILAVLYDGGGDSDWSGMFVPLPAPFKTIIVKIVLIGIFLTVAIFAGENRIRPLEARILLTGAKRAIADSRPDRGLYLSLKTLSIDPNEGEALFTAGAAELQMNEPEKALSYLLKARKLSGDPNLLFDISLAYSYLGKMNTAIAIMESLRNTIPGDIRPKKMLALYYFKTGRGELAVDMLKESNRTEPADKETARVLKQLRQPVVRKNSGLR